MPYPPTLDSTSSVTAEPLEASTDVTNTASTDYNHKYKDFYHDKHKNKEFYNDKHKNKEFYHDKHKNKEFYHDKHKNKEFDHVKHKYKEFYHDKHKYKEFDHDKHKNKEFDHDKHKYKEFDHDKHKYKEFYHDKGNTVHTSSSNEEFEDKKGAFYIVEEFQHIKFDEKVTVTSIKQLMTRGGKLCVIRSVMLK